MLSEPVLQPLMAISVTIQASQQPSGGPRFGAKEILADAHHERAVWVQAAFAKPKPAFERDPHVPDYFLVSDPLGFPGWAPMAQPQASMTS